MKWEIDEYSSIVGISQKKYDRKRAWRRWTQIRAVNGNWRTKPWRAEILNYKMRRRSGNFQRSCASWEHTSLLCMAQRFVVRCQQVMERTVEKVSGIELVPEKVRSGANKSTTVSVRGEVSILNTPMKERTGSVLLCGRRVIQTKKSVSLSFPGQKHCETLCWSCWKPESTATLQRWAQSGRI